MFALRLLRLLRFHNHAGDRFVCIRRLKSVRRQFNEFHIMKRTLSYLTVALLSYAVVVVVILNGQNTIVRRVAIFCEIMIILANFLFHKSP